MEKYKDIPYFVGLAGRFDMAQIPATRYSAEQTEELEKTGQTIWY